MAFPLNILSTQTISLLNQTILQFNNSILVSQSLVSVRLIDSPTIAHLPRIFQIFFSSVGSIFDRVSVGLEIFVISYPIDVQLSGLFQLFFCSIYSILKRVTLSLKTFIITSPIFVHLSRFFRLFLSFVSSDHVLSHLL